MTAGQQWKRLGIKKWGTLSMSERGPDLTSSPTVPAGRGRYVFQSNWTFRCRLAASNLTSRESVQVQKGGLRKIGCRIDAYCRSLRPVSRLSILVRALFLSSDARRHLRG